MPKMLLNQICYGLALGRSVSTLPTEQTFEHGAIGFRRHVVLHRLATGSGLQKLMALLTHDGNGFDPFS
jgi:hypothetical protein